MLSPIIFALSFLSAFQPASATVKDRLSLGSSLVETSGCKLSFPKVGRDYDLCPLFSAHGHTVGSTAWEESTPPTITWTEIKWNFGGPLARVENTKESEQCPPGTWICMTTTNRRIVDHGKVPPRITRLVPIAGQLIASKKHSEHEGHEDEDEILHSTGIGLEATIEDVWKSNNALMLRLHGGMYAQKEQHALFRMTCDEAAEEPTSPTYAWQWNGTYRFEWRTRHACATSVRDAAPPPKSDEDKPKEVDEDPPEDDGDRDQGFAPTPATTRVWTKVVWFFAALTAIGFVFAVLTNRLPGAKRVYPALRTFAAHHPLAPLYRRFTFRLGEAGLLRWARRRAGYEDLSRYDAALFDAAELDGAEEWVNGRGSGEGTLVGDGDVSGLPFSASPRKTTFSGIKSYGTR